jgi:glycosyltransferase involved in cell wall biosynthesis
MNILFCSEGFIIDGVASYNLYLSGALKQAGHNVAIIGRWAPGGFQKRHRQAGVTVIQCPSLTVSHPWLIRQARQFAPDVIITDARRSFPLSQRIQKQTGAKVITVFHDPPQPDKTGIRGVQALADGSDAWVTSEESIYQELLAIKPERPVELIQRPITGVVQCTPLPPKDPFRVLCIGRLSKWKAPGFRAIVENASELKKAIPSLQIDILGGGRRRVNFWMTAMQGNRRQAETYIHIRGATTNPQPWIQKANVVCAGATSAVEAILSGRPVLAFSGFWIGQVTAANLETAAATHFGERQGAFYVREQPEIICQSIIELYNQWQEKLMAQHVKTVRQKLIPFYDANAVSRQFNRLFLGFNNLKLKTY